MAKEQENLDTAPEDQIPVDEKPPVVAEGEAPKPTEGDEPPEPERDASVAGDMAKLTHEEVRESPAFQGVLKDLTASRERVKILEDAATAAETTPAKGDDDDDVFTRRQVREIMAEDRESFREELRAEFTKGNVAARQESYQHGLDALRADQIAGNIPAGVSTDKLMKQAVDVMKESDPEILQTLLSKPNAARKIWNYAKATIPAIGAALDKARTAETDAEKERIAKGGSPEGAEGSSNVDDFTKAIEEAAA